MMRYIVNAKLVLETGILWEGYLAMDGECIAGAMPCSQRIRRRQLSIS